MKKRLLLTVLCVVMLLGILPFNCFALEDPEVRYSPYCAVYNIENDKYCYEESIDVPIAPAGTVKIMTAILAIEYYADRMDTEITVQASWLAEVDPYSHTAGFMANETLTADKLISVLVINSANDAAYILANAIKGDTASFVAEMNQRAADLGMENTLYTNPAGTDDEGMYTTVRDVVTLSKYASSFPKYIEMTDSPSVVLPGTAMNYSRTLYSRNHFVTNRNNTRYLESSVFGFNCSMTENAGWCLSVAGKKDGLTYIVVVMGANDPSEATTDAEKDKFFVSGYEDARSLLRWAYDSFEYFTIIDTSTMICEVPVSLSSKVDHVMLLPAERIVAFLPKDTDLDTAITKTWTLNEKSIEAPLEKGETVGMLTVSYGDEVLGQVPLVTKNNVTRSTGLYIGKKAIDIVTHPVFIVCAVVAVLAIIAYVIVMAKYMSAKKQVVRFKTNKK